MKNKLALFFYIMLFSMQGYAGTCTDNLSTSSSAEDVIKAISCIENIKSTPGPMGLKGDPGVPGNDGATGPAGPQGNPGIAASGEIILKKYRRGRFNNVQNLATIPGSKDAALCGLSTVDDDSPAGSCTVLYDKNNKEWMYLTGGDSGENGCGFQCVWLSTK